MVKIAPSLLAGNYLDMGSSVKTAECAGADYLHCDIMDGSFVPNISFGSQMVREIHRTTDVPLDVHLMIERPERYIERFADAGAHVITFHVEATVHIQRTLQLIRQTGVKAGIALNPATPLDCVRYVLDDVDMILLMSVNPGYGGQLFLPSTLRKLADLRRMIEEHNKSVAVEVDGGITVSNAGQIAQAGASILVVGTAFFGAQNPAAVVDAMRDAARGIVRSVG